MNEKYMYSLIAVFLLALLAYLCVEVADLDVVFGVVLPYVAILLFIGRFTGNGGRYVLPPLGADLQPYCLPAVYENGPLGIPYRGYGLCGLPGTKKKPLWLTSEAERVLQLLGESDCDR